MSSSNSPPGTPMARSDANLAHTSSASPEATQQPPFPQAGTVQGESERTPPAKHPNTENLINATAKHIIPDVPAPSAEDDEDKAQISKPGKDEDQREAREEEPLLKGTPLDELITPGFARAPPSFTSAKQPVQVERKEEEETLQEKPSDFSRVQEDKGKQPERQHQQQPVRQLETRQQPGRPGFGAMRGVGSDSVSHVI